MRAALIADDAAELELIKAVLSRMTIRDNASLHYMRFDVDTHPSYINVLSRNGAIVGHVPMCDLEALVHEVKSNTARQELK